MRLRRAGIVLASVQGRSAVEAAGMFAAIAQYAREMINAFNDQGFAAPDPKWSGGRPHRFGPHARETIARVAKTAPAQLGLPFTTWSLTKIVEHLVGVERIVVSTETVRQVLRAAGISWQATKTWKGSRDFDRDETVADHKPFEVLADALARAGVAALRVDDRGVGASTGRPGELDYDGLTDDVVACVHLLRSQEGIDPERVGLIGHSQGGYLAPLAVGLATPGAVADVVLLTTPALPGLRVLKDQTTAILRAEDLSATAINARITRIDTLAAHLRSDDLDGAVAEGGQRGARCHDLRAATRPHPPVPRRVHR